MSQSKQERNFHEVVQSICSLLPEEVANMLIKHYLPYCPPEWQWSLILDFLNMYVHYDSGNVITINIYAIYCGVDPYTMFKRLWILGY